MPKIKEKLGQEEIVGFAVIVIIVSIVLVFFLIFSLQGKNQVESYEASSFLQSMLQYTSTCQINFCYLSVQGLISSCDKNETCKNEKEACAVLNETLNGILDKSWQTGPEFPVKGYKLDISSAAGSIFSAQKGDITSTQEGAQQIIPEGSASIQILFNKYS